MSSALLLRGNVFGAANREEDLAAPLCILAAAAALGLIGRGGASFLLFPHPHPNLIITLPLSLLPTAHHHHLLLHPQCGSRLHSRSDTLNSWQGIFASRTVRDRIPGIKDNGCKTESETSRGMAIIPGWNLSDRSAVPSLGLPTL